VLEVDADAAIVERARKPAQERPAADEQRVIIVVPIHNIFAHTR
jgi:hypothetical protein